MLGVAIVKVTLCFNGISLSFHMLQKRLGVTGFLNILMP